MKLFSVLLGAVLTLFAVSSAVNAAAPVKSSSESSGADVSFSSVEGSVETYGYLTASDQVFNGTAESSVWLGISTYDLATEESHFYYGFAYLAAEQLVTDSALSSASLTADVNVCEEVYDEFGDPLPGECQEMSIDLTWQGEGIVDSSSGKSRYKSTDCTTMSSFESQYRSASAWGSISSGVTNFTSGGADWADLFHGQSKDVSHGDGCYNPTP